MGKYTLQFDVCFRTSIRFLLCTLFYAYPLRRKEHFSERVAVGLLIILLFSGAIGFIRTNFNVPVIHILCRILNYLFPLPLLFLLFCERTSILLLAWCAGVATEELAVHFFYLLLTLSGASTVETNSFFAQIHPVRDSIIYYGIQIAVCLLCIRLFGRAEQTDETDYVLRRNVAVLSVVSALALGILNSITREFQQESRTLYLVILLFNLLLGLFILVLRTNILTQSRYRIEIALMERVLHEEKKQYESMKENIDIINIKCHDLKHQLANFEGRLTEQEVHTLREAICIYDSNIKTGNETLDVLLYEKQLVCQKEAIQMSCMADGAALDFMSMSHVYALFNNAIGNAIEAVRQIPDLQKRVISITVRREDTNVVIHVVNYFAGERNIAGGLPTTKQDRNRHGFGMRSMKYIAEQYHGTLSAAVRGECFHLTITFPENNVVKGAHQT